MTKRIENKGALKRGMLALVVLLLSATLMVGAVSAEDTPVAKIESDTGTLEFTTLEGAFERAVSDDVITLLQDISIVGDGTTPAGIDIASKSLTLNLNEKTITATNGVAKDGVFDISNGASLTVIGPGKIDSSDFQYTFHVIDTGILAINGGEFVGSAGGCIHKDGTGGKITITAGSFSCGEYDGKSFVINQQDASAEIGAYVITGGSFKNVNPSACNNEAVPEDYNYLPSGYTVASEEIDGAIWYTVVPPVAKIGETGYATLVDAYTAASAGETIELLCDASGGGISVNKDVTFDLGGYTYNCIGPAVGSTGTKTQLFQLLSGNVVIKNGTLTSTAGSGTKILIQNYANLVLDNVTLDGSNLDGTNPGTASFNHGTSTLKGETVIKAKSGGIAFDVCYAFGGGYNTVSVTIEGDDVTINGAVACTIWTTYDSTNKIYPAPTEDEKKGYFNAVTFKTPAGYVISDLDTTELSPCQYYWKVSDDGKTQTLALYEVKDATSPAGESVKQDSGAVKVTVTGGNYDSEAMTVTTTTSTDGITAVITFIDVKPEGSDAYVGNISTVDYGYKEEPAVTPAGDGGVNAPTSVTYTVNLTLVNTTSYLPKMNAAFDVTVKGKAVAAGIQPVAMVTAETNVGEINGNLTKTTEGITIVFTVPATWVDSIGKDSGKIFGFHAKDDGSFDPMRIPGSSIVPAGNFYKITVKSSTFSTVGLGVGPAPAPQSSSSSSSSGSSVWLQEPVTEQPTQTPMPTPTEQPTTPTDTVPTDIPVTQPTATPASPGFGILAALAGLGAVAVLRRQ